MTTDRRPMKALEVRAFIGDLLDQMGLDHSLGERGQFIIRYEGIVVLIEATDDDVRADRTAAMVRIVVALGTAPASPEVYRWVATRGGDFYFGNLYASEADGDLEVYFGHTLLGDYLDTDELASALAAMSGSAVDLEREFTQTFGGRPAF